MQNGKLTTIRVIAAGLLGLVGTAGGIFLLYAGKEVPTPFWGIVIISILGVVGVDVAAAIIQGWKNKGV